MEKEHLISPFHYRSCFLSSARFQKKGVGEESNKGRRIDLIVGFQLLFVFVRDDSL